MATRNLARTIMEGGRHRQSTVDRRFRNRRLRRVRFDDDGDLIGRAPDPGAACVYHHDRLGPLERWLRSQIGRSWARAFQELCTVQDGRTTKGRHLRDHVRWEVEEDGYRWWRRFFVDDAGILRAAAPRPRRIVSPPPPPTSWIAGRRVIERGGALFWTARTVDPDAQERFVSGQGKRLTTMEEARWHALPEGTRAGLRYAPVASDHDRRTRGTTLAAGERSERGA